MKAIIPVAGMGTRLRPHTHTLPKVLLNVAGKPIIAHIMDQIIRTRIDHVVFVVGYLGDIFENWAREHYPHLSLEFIEQPQTLGLAHAVDLGLKFDDDEVMIILGDTIFEVDLDGVLASPVSTLGIHEVEDARRFGVVLEQEGRIVDLVEKSPHPPSNRAIVGLYFIKRGALLKDCIREIIEKNITTKGEYQITDALRLMVQKGDVITTFPVAGWYDCGAPETLLSSNRHLLQRDFGNGDHIALFRQKNIIHPPVFIAPNATVEGSIIGPYTTIGEGVSIREAIIKDSIIGDKAKVECALLTRSIIGREALVTGNYKKLNISDKSEISFV
ncbi:MAG: nucleotidyl transferase [Candidatus Zixiibacteriota bacterium]|nr:MAG: nucleotidyl transferase [candidate division Zixibacteria bacterium]